MARVKLLTQADAFLASVPTLSFTVSTGAENTSVAVSTNTVGNSYQIALTIPRGVRGLTGLTPALAIGTVTTGAAGSTSSATLRGTTDNPILDLTIARGITGATPAFAIGNITTGAAGSSASVGLRGTAESPILDLTIPRGNTGLTPSLTIGNVSSVAFGGTTSAALRGTTDNPILDLVLVRGQTGLTPSLTIGNVTTGVAGTSATASLRGTTDAPILDLTIPRGITGLTPTITIGTVTTLSPGTSATASFRGTAENPILDLAIPRGTAGSGTGDVVAANNGSEYTATKDTFHANLGAGIGTGGGRAVYYAADAAAVRVAIGAAAASAIGTAGMYNVGTTSGTIGVLGTGGVFPTSMIPFYSNGLAPVTLTDAASVALDLSAGSNFILQITNPVGTTRALTNPTNARAGQSGWIKVIQDANGGRLLTYGTNYKADDGITFPTLNPTANAITYLRYYVSTTSEVIISGGRSNASTSDYLLGTATTYLSPATFWNAQVPFVLTDASTVTLDLSTAVNFSLLMTTAVGANRTLAVTNAKVGQRGFIRCVSPSGIPALLTYSAGIGGNFRTNNNAEPILNSGPNAVTVLDYEVTASGEVLISAGRTLVSGTTAEFLGGTATSAISPLSYWGAQVSTTLADSTVFNVDFSTGINFSLLTTTAVGITRVLNVSNATKVGQRGFIRVVQAAGLVAPTVHNVIFGPAFRYGDNTTSPLVNSGAGAVTVFDYEITASGEVSISGGRTFSSTSELLIGTGTAAINPTSFWASQVPITLTDNNGTIALDLSTGINFKVQLDNTTANPRLFSNPTNAKQGQRGFIRVTQPASGTVNSVGFGSAYRLDDTTASVNTALGSITVFRYEVTASGEITLSGGKPQTANPEATAAEYRSATAGRVLAPDKVWAANQVVTLSDAQFAGGVNFNNFINAQWPLFVVGNTNIANPIGGMKPGQSGVISIVNLAVPTGFVGPAPTLTFEDQWFSSNGTLPTISGAGGSITRLFYTITSTGTVDMFFASNMGRTYDPDAKAYFDAMTVPPSAARKVLINDLIKGLKTDGLWLLLDNLWLLAGHDEQATRVNVRRPSKVLVKYNSPYYVTDLGWQATSSPGGVSTAQLISPDAYFGASLARYQTMDVSFGVWQNTTITESSNGYLCGETSNNFYDHIYQTSATYGRLGGSTYTSYTSAQYKGLRAISHLTGQTNQSLFANNTFNASAYTNANNSQTTFSLLNAGGQGSYNGTSNRQAAGFTGAGLSNAQITLLNNRLNTYLTAIGAN